MTAPKTASPPKFVSPTLATATERPPRGDAWLHETKFDGYRILAHVSDGSARLQTRRGKDWTARMPTLARAVAALGLRDSVLDGEVCAIAPDGTTSFHLLQEALSEESDESLVYMVFDLPFHDGRDMRDTPLVERKRVLERLLKRKRSRPRSIRLSAHVVGVGPWVLEKACDTGLEGIVSKKASSRYGGNRTRDWLKCKCERRQELVIGGYSAPSGSRTHFGALLVGSYGGDGGLVYRGKVGTGFTERTLERLHQRLRALERKTPPFEDPPSGRDVTWVRPQLVAEVAFTELTRDGKLRHPRFKGLREDKPASEVEIEEPAPARAGNPEGRANAGAPSRHLELTNPDKVLYTDQGLSKRDLADYVVQVAEWMLPYVDNRPLTLVRCPEGQSRSCFYQKHRGAGAPDAIRAAPLEEGGKQVTYMTVRDPAGLVALVQLGVLEVHVWGSRADRPDRPDQLVFDLDPDEGLDFARVAAAARETRERLRLLGLTCYLRSTGGKGLHVVVPVDRRRGWKETKSFCKALAWRMEQDSPERYTSTLSKARRRGKVFVDYLRNGRGATSIACYSTRARPGAPVATPLRWDELGASTAPSYDVRSMVRRLARLRSDPWDGYFDVRQSLTKGMLKAVGAL